MTIVLVPDFGGKLVEGFAGYIAVIAFEAVDPDDQLVTLVCRQRNTVFQFNQAHRDISLPQQSYAFKPKQMRSH